MRKPDGLFIIEAPTICRRCCTLEAARPERHRPQHGERACTPPASTPWPELCAASKPVLHRVWGGVLGDRLWHLLRGDEIPDLVSARKTIGHSHVLPPDCRHPDKAWPILCKLLHKACERLRSHGLLAGSLTMQLAFLPRRVMGGRSADGGNRFHHALMRLLDRLWRDRPEPRCQLLQVGVVLTRLCERAITRPPCSRP
jgi:DNA polymerase IV